MVHAQALYSLPLETDNGSGFFGTLRRLDIIRQDCKQLISSSLQAAGIEILVRTSLFSHRVGVRTGVPSTTPPLQPPSTTPLYTAAPPFWEPCAWVD